MDLTKKDNLEENHKINGFSRKDLRLIAENDFKEINSLPSLDIDSRLFYQLQDKQRKYKDSLIENFTLDEKVRFWNVMAEETQIQNLITQENVTLFEIQNGLPVDIANRLKASHEAKQKLVENWAIEEQQEFWDYLLLKAKESPAAVAAQQERFKSSVDNAENNFQLFQAIIFFIAFILVLFVIKALFF